MSPVMDGTWPTPTPRHAAVGTLVDPRLVAGIGPLDGDIAAAVRAEVADALVDVHRLAVPTPGRPAAPPPLPADGTAPGGLPTWALDLARGLHWLARRGSRTRSGDLVRALAPSVGADHLDAYACHVDVTWALVQGRYVAGILGPSATGEPVESLQSRHPWFDATALGFRIDLVLEIARLAAPGP